MKPETAPRKVRFAGFEVDFAQREIRKRGVRVRLQHKPFQILELLLRHPGTLVTREEIARHLWPDSHVSFEHSLNTAVNALRQVLGDSLHSSHLIETRPGLGYSFAAAVEEIEPPPARTAGIEIHHDYLKGRYLLNKMTEEDTGKAVAYFESALLDNQRSALACAGLADAWCDFARLSMASARTAGVKAKEYAVRALSNDSQLTESHLSLARVKLLFDWDWKAAETEFLRALELNPLSAPTHLAYALLHCMRNHQKAALEQIRKAQAIEPLSRAAGLEYAWILYLGRNYEGAAEQCWKMLALEPRFWQAQLILGSAYQQLGLKDEGIAELRNAVVCSGRHPMALAILSRNDPAEGEPVLRELDEQAAGRYVPPSAYVLAHAGSGATTSALASLERAFDERDINLLWLHRSPLLESLMNDFQDKNLRASPLRTSAANG